MATDRTIAYAKGINSHHIQAQGIGNSICMISRMHLTSCKRHRRLIEQLLNVHDEQAKWVPSGAFQCFNQSWPESVCWCSGPRSVQFLAVHIMLWLPLGLEYVRGPASVLQNEMKLRFIASLHLVRPNCVLTLCHQSQCGGVQLRHVT